MVSFEVALGEKAASDVVGSPDAACKQMCLLNRKLKQGKGQIVEDFKRIYNTRSQIVHKGNGRLTREELQGPQHPS